MNLTKTWANVPNALSVYRILAFPVLLYCIYTEQESPFVVLIVANLISDILDGFIARRFHLETELGARLDSMADNGTYIAAILGLFTFKWMELEPHLYSFILFIGMFLATVVFALVKFKRLPSLHLYSMKIGGYIQGGFFFVTFVFDFYDSYYYFMLVWGLMAFTEHLLVQAVLPEMRSNAKGLYWVLKK